MSNEPRDEVEAVEEEWMPASRWDAMPTKQTYPSTPEEREEHERGLNALWARQAAEQEAPNSVGGPENS